MVVDLDGPLMVFDPMHFLPLLEQKVGALVQRPLK